MADKATIDLFHRALNYGLQSLGFANTSLKEKQYEVLRELVVKKSDVLAVLPTGYGKSLIYQLLPPVLTFMAWIFREKVFRDSYFTIKCTKSRSNC